jgi:hypothetical protein
MQPTVVGLAEAARVAGVSESTIRRRRDELQALGAVQTAKGWQIPIPALIELGLMARTTAPDELAPPDTSHETPVEDVMTGSTASEVEALRGALRAAEQRAAVAEAVAQERERIIEAQAQTLRMLEAPRHPAMTPVTTPAVIAPEPAVTPLEEGPLTPPDRVHREPASRRKWWRFGTD